MHTELPCAIKVSKKEKRGTVAYCLRGTGIPIRTNKPSPRHSVSGSLLISCVFEKCQFSENKIK